MDFSPALPACRVKAPGDDYARGLGCSPNLSVSLIQALLIICSSQQCHIHGALYTKSISYSAISTKRFYNTPKNHCSVISKLLYILKLYLFSSLTSHAIQDLEIGLMSFSSPQLFLDCCSFYLGGTVLSFRVRSSSLLSLLLITKDYQHLN